MIKPLPGYCLIQPIEDEGKSAGGLYLPDSSKDKPMKGKIVEISPIGFSPTDKLISLIGIVPKEISPGDILMNEYSKLQIGTIVIYKKWTNQEVTHEGKEYLLVAFSELLAIVE